MWCSVDYLYAIDYHCNAFISISMMRGWSIIWVRAVAVEWPLQLQSWSDSYTIKSYACSLYWPAFQPERGSCITHKVLSNIYPMGSEKLCDEKINTENAETESTIKYITFVHDTPVFRQLGNPVTCCQCRHVPPAPLSSIGTVCISQVIGILWLHQHL